MRIGLTLGSSRPARVTGRFAALVVLIVALCAPAAPARAANYINSQLLAGVESLAVIASHAVAGGAENCLPDEAEVRTAVELVLRRSGIGVGADRVPGRALLELSASVLRPTERTCAIGYSVRVLRPDPVGFYLAYSAIGVVSAGNLADPPGYYRSTVIPLVEEVANEILKARDAR